MRGKLNAVKRLVLGYRITPAHAGKTDTYFTRSSVIKDHPRACGENVSTNSDKAANIGSPPRMRGKRAIQLLKLWQQRITPAHAGKTIDCDAHINPSQDHPRACGENKMAKFPKKYETGSPPRMRGKHII